MKKMEEFEDNSFNYMDMLSSSYEEIHRNLMSSRLDPKCCFLADTLLSLRADLKIVNGQREEIESIYRQNLGRVISIKELQELADNPGENEVSGVIAKERGLPRGYRFERIIEQLNKDGKDSIPAVEILDKLYKSYRTISRKYEVLGSSEEYLMPYRTTDDLSSAIDARLQLISSEIKTKQSELDSAKRAFYRSLEGNIPNGDWREAAECLESAHEVYTDNLNFSVINKVFVTRSYIVLRIYEGDYMRIVRKDIKTLNTETVGDGSKVVHIMQNSGPVLRIFCTTKRNSFSG